MINQQEDIYVVLVDENDNPLGVMEKMEAHRKALLHRAVSVFIFSTKGEWLLQRRAVTKYHSKSLWSNACCTHPYPSETSINTAYRRLMEEMGMSRNLKKLFQFIYQIKLDDELTEHELDHVFIGVTDDIPRINEAEVSAWKSINPASLEKDIRLNPEDYSFWFKEIYRKVKDRIANMPIE